MWLSLLFFSGLRQPCCRGDCLVSDCFLTLKIKLKQLQCMSCDLLSKLVDIMQGRSTP